jgi:hypothetical protein
MVRRVVRVVGWLVLAVLVVAIVCGGLYALSQWHPLENDPRNALELVSTRLNWTAIASIVTAVAVVVIALFAIRVSRANDQALHVASEQVAASAAARDAAMTAAESAIRAVEASAHSTDVANRLADATDRALADQRRQAAIAATPILSLSRPTPVRGPNGLELATDVLSNGPGVAFDVRLGLETQAPDTDQYLVVPDAAAGVPLLNARQTVVLRVAVPNLQNHDVSWAEAWPGGGEPQPPPGLLVPARIRVRLRWRSLAGANAQLASVWETRDIAGEDASAWRLEELRITPPEGDPLVVV